VNPERRQALLVMDMMNGVVARFNDAGSAKLVERLRRAVEHAREAGIPVIHVRVAFRDGYPEVSPANKSFSALAQAGGLRDEDAATAVVDQLAPAPGDLVVTKRRVSAFTGSDLEVVLRSRGIDALVLTGIATSGVVLSTLREAADRDYRLVVLSDGCLDADPEVHRVLTEKVFPRQAEVTTIGDWIG
jgi:nicotinamidase-related amidase